MNELNWSLDKRAHFLLDLMLLVVLHTLSTDKDIIRDIFETLINFLSLLLDDRGWSPLFFSGK